MMMTIRMLPAAAAMAAFLPAQIPECKDMQTTASGLQYGVLQKGRAEPAPTATDMVEVHYTGWLTNGTKFDSSHDRGQTATFAVRDVIKGWTEGLQLMTPGARYKLVIPPSLGYGAQETGSIPANSTLVFDVELLKVIALPKFVAARAEAQKSLPCGFKFEVLAPGTGAKAEANEAVAYRYAIFDADGKLLDCSQMRNDNLLSGTKATLAFPFLKELVDEMEAGCSVRVEVPGGTVRSFAGDTVWVLELAGVHKLPKFRKLDEAKTVTTQSGLKYEVIEPGAGDPPKASSTVAALYTGWLLDGTMFDSAHARGMPSEFALTRVIKGWTEGLQLMQPGGKFLFEIPPELAYGSRGSPPRIGPNETLVFLVELVAVK
jgi:FKBP-type peptidyl-prolyl cis-trans isomerase